jgi:hypothetical protein
MSEVDLTPEPGQPRDTRLIEKALRKRWPIPETYREAIIKRQVAIAIDPKAANRESTSAAKCLVAMEAQNMADEKEPAASGVTVNIQNNDCNIHSNDGATEFASILAAALERARKAETSGTPNTPAEPQPAVPQPPAD